MEMSKTTDYGWTDAIPGSSGYINSAVVQIADRIGGRKILDAGCGNGALAADLARAGYDVTGVDGDEGAIRIAQRMFPNIRFEVGLFEEAPPGLFDLVSSTE